MSRLTLERSIGVTHATAMVVGTIIGASIFVQPSEVSRHVPTPAGMLLAWLIAGVLTFFGALVCAELASAFPRSGGVYVFLKETFSPAVGFLWGWAMFWSMHSGIIAAIAVVFARYLSYYVRIGDTGMRAVAIGAIAILTAINCLGVKPGSRLQTLFAAGKVLAIVMIIGVVMLLGARVPRGTTVAPEVAFSARELTLAVVAGLFAFGGWHMVTYTAEETRSPTRTIPLALTIGTATVTICYLALNAAYLYVLPVERVVSSTRIAADAAEALVGNRGGAVIAGLVMFSSLGALNGIILTGPRVYLAMARDGLLFRSMGAIHPRFRTPYIALIVQALWSSVLVMTGTYRSLFTRVIYTEWIFFALMALGLFRLRGRPDYAPAYRAWGYPVVPLLFALSSGTIVATQIASDLAESAAGLLLVAVGLPVYYLWESDRAKRGRQLRPGDLA